MVFTFHVDFNSEYLLIIRIGKEVIKNNILILLNNPILTHNKRRKQPQILRSQKSIRRHLLSLLKKRLYQLINLPHINLRFNRFLIILQDAN